MSRPHQLPGPKQKNEGERDKNDPLCRVSNRLKRRFMRVTLKQSKPLIEIIEEVAGDQGFKSRHHDPAVGLPAAMDARIAGTQTRSASQPAA